MKKTTKKFNLEDLVMDMGGESPYVDYDNRELLIDGEITSDAIRDYILPIISWNKWDDDQGLEEDERQEITIYIATWGGDAIAGMNLVNIIECSKTPIKTVTFFAYSMGCLIALAGHRKYCYENSSFLIHDGSLNLSNTSGKVRDMFNFFAVKNDKMVQDFILKHTEISRKQLNSKWRTDWYLDSKDALKLGIVDEILTKIV